MTYWFLSCRHKHVFTIPSFLKQCFISISFSHPWLFETICISQFYLLKITLMQIHCNMVGCNHFDLHQIARIMGKVVLWSMHIFFFFCLDIQNFWVLAGHITWRGGPHLAHGSWVWDMLSIGAYRLWLGLSQGQNLVEHHD